MHISFISIALVMMNTDVANCNTAHSFTSVADFRDSSSSFPLLGFNKGKYIAFESYDSNNIRIF